MNLDNVRIEIDSIDDELIRLFDKRMQLVADVAKVKIKEGLPIFHPEREETIIKKAKDKVTAPHSGYADTFFSSLMDISRQYQHQIIDSHKLKNIDDAIKSETIPMENPTVACAGVPGSYTGTAAQFIYPTGKYLFFETFEDVIIAVKDGKADYGVLPVENTIAGSVTECFDLLYKYKFYITGTKAVSISHCLVATPDAKIEDIREIYSHPQGISQCQPFLKTLKNASTYPCSNTAIAAEMVAKCKDKSKAAISSSEAAKLYGLNILAENIQSNGKNQTRFVSVSPTLNIAPDADRISLAFSIPHKTGSLYRTLARFSYAGLNLTKIESRPIPEKGFEYLFYLDFLGNVHSQNVLSLLNALAEELPDFTFLGNYKSIDN
jgi:chorismate mutase/prephenate dehydratase